MGISEQVESMANTAFALVQGNRQNLASIGDLLQSAALLASVKPGKEEGVGAGASSIPLIFSAKNVKISNPVNKINFLVDEYISLLGQVQSRWPMGLGKYLLSKVEINMQVKGILEVDRITGKPGNWVFINGHSVGLSSRLSTFESLATRMTTYTSVLGKMTGKLAAKTARGVKMYVKPPEWQGK